MLKLITKYRHETIIKEMEDKHQQELKHKEAKYKRYKENNDNEKYKLEKEIKRLREELRLKDITLQALDFSAKKLDDALTEEENKNKELNRKNEKLEKEKKDLQSKVNLSIIAKHQLQSLCICKLDKKNFMYSLDLTPVHISVSGRKVYDIAKLLG